MTTETDVPLLEAIFEVRWGSVDSASLDANNPEFLFKEDDNVFFFGQFNSVAIGEGYSKAVPINQLPAGLRIPHIVSHRFTRPDREGHCVQIGLGVLTVNQRPEGYDWKPYRDAILEGVNMLRTGHPSGGNLPLFWLDLRYQDFFPYGEGERAIDVLRKKLTIKLQIPDEATKLPTIEKDSLDLLNLAFKVSLSQPKSQFSLELHDVKVNGRPGALAQMSVRASLPQGDPMSLEPAALAKWLEDAHTAHKHWFQTLLIRENTKGRQ